MGAVTAAWGGFNEGEVMKANFSLEQRYVPKWKDNDKLAPDQQLVAKLKMPTVQDVFSILERFAANGVSGKIDTDAPDALALGMKRSTAIASEVGTYLPKYVELVNAEDFKIEDVIQYPPFFDLAVELLFALVSFAQPNEADEKN